MGARDLQRIVNLTPHAVLVRGNSGETVFESEGVVRVVDHAEPAGTVGAVDIVSLTFGDVVGLPEPQAGTGYLVSRIVALALPHRADLLFPYAEIRDDRGRIIAVEALAQIGPPTI